MKEKRRISSFSIIISFLCLAIAGIGLIPLLTVKLSPSRTLPSLSVDFNMPATQSRVVEMEVTSRLESMLSRIRGVRNVESSSSYGAAWIRLEFDKHANMDAARFEASSVIKQTWPRLPEGVSYPLIRVNSPDGSASKPFMTYTVSAPSASEAIQRFAENVIRPRLLGLQGLSGVSVYGAPPMEWSLEYKPEQLSALGISLEDIRRAISRYYHAEFLGTGMTAGDGSNSRLIRMALEPGGRSDGFDASLISVRGRGGNLLRLDQLLTVSYAEQVPQSYYRINGQNSVYISLSAVDDANQLRLSRMVKQQIGILKEAMPQGFSLRLSYDATDYIHKELEKIYLRSGLTLAILLIFVLITSRNVRHLFLIASTLAINLSIAVVFYYLMGLQIQLYSLAGITISMGLVVDYTIVMTDHLLNRGNRSAYLSVLAATLTIVGSLAVIFFLNEEVRLNLQDFALVIIVNLGVSLLVTLFLVPAIADELALKEKKRKRTVRYFRRAATFGKFYQGLIRFLSRWRWAVCVLLVMSFGLPVFLLPEKLEERDILRKVYNRVFGSELYKEDIKPVSDKLLGGMLRLFVQEVYDSSYFTDNEETVLTIRASMPNGTTIEQMNVLIKGMESFLSGYKQIRQFQTNIYDARQAMISVYFHKADVAAGFPYILKSAVISKALELGGGNWGVWGLEDMGFSNDVRENAGSYRAELLGYNYDDLYKQAEQLRTNLLKHPRIREVTINSEFSFFKDDYQEFVFTPDRQRLAEDHFSAADLLASVTPALVKDVSAGYVVTKNEMTGLRLHSSWQRHGDIWKVVNSPFKADSQFLKLSSLVAVRKEQTSPRIAKINQQYRLCLQYEYIGAVKQGDKVLERELLLFNETLPVGYSAKSGMPDFGWGEKDNSRYLLLLLVIAIIFFTTSILFNSLRLPFAILFIIPVSYIGVFLTFYVFKLNFDQGGFASFVLLCGLTVNAGIYILKEYIDIRRKWPQMDLIRAYVKAWNAKVIPVLLTVISTILGFLPFFFGAKEGFWFPLAAGTTGGLMMSLAGIFFFLPAFTIRRR